MKVPKKNDKAVAHPMQLTGVTGGKTLKATVNFFNLTHLKSGLLSEINN